MLTKLVVGQEAHSQTRLATDSMAVISLPYLVPRQNQHR